ncbi:type II methionyl aminopeptidase [Candidatus Woesearchaeota archaeon]|nr:type II methionyl aminopeptidase [Candidatus Woesearchaeota archaeon]
MLTQEQIKDWKQSGKISAEALQYGKSLIKPGASMLEVLEKIESKIKELGGEIAFPAQMAANEVAAHFCPDADDNTILEDQILSLDIGAHVNGHVTDTALTVDLSGKYTELVKASEQALHEVMKVLQIGIEIGQIGKLIEETIASYGYKPVRNLSGHGVGIYNVHIAPNIPNCMSQSTQKLEKGMVIAIEPFASTGAGVVIEKGAPTVFSLLQSRSVRTGFVRDVLKEVEQRNELPFTTRWLLKKFSRAQLTYALKQLEEQHIIRSYPPLVDRANGMVSQAEKTFLIDDEVTLLT